MKSEQRIYKASILAGLSDILISFFAENKLFGVLGVGMVFYGVYHYALYRYDGRNK